MLEVLDGSIAVSAPVLLDEVPNKLRQTLQVKGLTPFRRTKLNAVISESMPFFEAHAASVKETERIEHFRGLERRISLWHGLKLGASTLGMWGSAVNLSTAIKRLGQHDGDVIARLLDVGNNAAGTVASGYGVQSAMQYVAMQRAAIRANGLAASVSNVATTLAERRMIGALSVSALAGALKAGGDQLDARGKVRTYIIIDSLMQFSDAAVAAAYLFGGKWGEMFGIAALTKFSSRPPGPVGVGLGPLIDRWAAHHAAQFRWPDEVERFCAEGADLSAYDTTPVASNKHIFYRYDRRAGGLYLCDRDGVRLPPSSGADTPDSDQRPNSQ